MQIAAWAGALLIVLILAGLMFMLSPKSKAGSSRSMPQFRVHVDWDAVSASVRSGFSTLMGYWTLARPHIGRFLNFLFTTKIGWGLIIASIIAGYIINLRNMTPTDFMVQQDGIPAEVMPWSGNLFPDWVSPEHHLSATNGTAWIAAVERRGDRVTFTYYVWDVDKEEMVKVDKFVYENGGEYQTYDGRTVVFQADDSGWKFVPK